MALIDIRVEAGPFDMAAEVARIRSAGVGAIVTFTGACRDEGGRLSALEIEHYPGMAEAELRRVAEETASRTPVTAITVVHRYGRIAVGDDIVLVAAASEHRQAAFEAAHYLMDYLKTHAPFWKREIRTDGTVGAWVGHNAADEKAAERWSAPPRK